MFDATTVLAAKNDDRIAVVIPARNEAATIGRIVEVVADELCRRYPLVDELVVVDDGSTDATASISAAAGARVVPSVGTGKGAAMWSGLAATSASVVAFCDGDLEDFRAHFVTGLVGPLVTDATVKLVKAVYQRPIAGQPDGGGRVTELLARPALRLLAPHLAGVAQPLGGEVASRRHVLEGIPFVDGYGVDVALLFDVARGYGVDSIAQVDLGTRVHRNRPLAELTGPAEVVLHTILHRAGVPGIAPVAERAPLDGHRSIPPFASTPR